MNETALAIVISPNLIGEDLAPQQHLKLANELNKMFARHIEGMRGEENPVTEWYQRLYVHGDDDTVDERDEDDDDDDDDDDDEKEEYHS